MNKSHKKTPCPFFTSYWRHQSITVLIVEIDTTHVLIVHEKRMREKNRIFRRFLPSLHCHKLIFPSGRKKPICCSHPNDRSQIKKNPSKLLVWYTYSLYYYVIKHITTGSEIYCNEYLFNVFTSYFVQKRSRKAKFIRDTIRN